MRPNRRTFVAGVAGTAIAAGCLAGDASPDADSVSLLLNWQPSGLHVPYYAAVDRGYYDDQGISVTVENGQGSDFSAQQVGIGNTEFAITSGDQVLNANSREISPLCVGVVMQRGPVVLFTSRDRFGEELTDPAQLEGATVGSGPGMVQVMAQSYLAHHDLLDGVEYVDSGFDTVQQLLSGEIDAAGGNFSDVVDARHQGATIDALSVEEAIPSYGHVVATSDDFAADHPDAVRAFLRATARGAAWAHDDPEAATDVLVERVPELEEARENQLDKWTELASTYMLSDAVASGGWGWSEAEPWERTHETLRDAGFLDGEVDPDAVWTNDYLDTEYEYVGDYAALVSD